MSKVVAQTSFGLGLSAFLGCLKNNLIDPVVEVSSTTIFGMLLLIIGLTVITGSWYLIKIRNESQ